MNLIDEPFDTWPLPGWTIDDQGDVGPTWNHCTTCIYDQFLDGRLMRVGYHPPNPSDAVFDDRLITPSFSTQAFAAVYVEFAYNYGTTWGSQALIEYRVDSGPWLQIASLARSDEWNAYQSFILPGAGNHDSVQVRFRYIAQQWDRDWFLDNVRVVAVP